MVPATAEPVQKGRKKRVAPDPIKANPDAAAQSLRLLIERIERLEEEKKGIGDDIADVYSEAKATGFDTKGMRAIIALRAKSKDVAQEEAAILETYKNALGLE
ncbi:MAG TPA: DUF2312 domain-containing protein [Sphingobium sp.]|uniref:DUF2312 domain-containing protein n=1 Tax=Sphingobium sp. TaxID=1912891 RepID=UPI002ED461A3